MLSKFKELIEKHIGVFAIINLALALTIIISVVQIIPNIMAISVYNDAISMFDDKVEPTSLNLFEQQENKEAEDVNTTSGSDDSSKVIAEYEEKIKDLEYKITESGTLTQQLTSVTNNLFNARQLVSPSQLDVVRSNIKEFVTDDCYNSYFANYYKSGENLDSYSWNLNTVSYSNLDTEEPKSLVTVSHGSNLKYFELGYTKEGTNWLVSSFREYLV